ncbi:hypothetical protein TKK_0012813 [Trichogramma kaykai]
MPDEHFSTVSVSRFAQLAVDTDVKGTVEVQMRLVVMRVLADHIVTRMPEAGVVPGKPEMVFQTKNNP